MMHIIYKSFKESLLVLAGTLVGVLATNYSTRLFENLWLIYGLIIAFIFIGSGLFDRFGRFIKKLIKAINQKRRRYAILSSYELIENHNSSWVKIKLTNLYTLFREKNIKIKKIDKISSCEYYPIVINPYGGSYPEENFEFFSSLNNIFKYVKGGGIFINIADIPFYYAYSKSHQRNIDTTPFAGSFRNDRSFFDTIITKKLAIYVLNSEGFSTNAKRSFVLNQSVDNLYDDAITIPAYGDSSPVISVKYGLGLFIFSTIEVNKHNIKNILKLIKYAENSSIISK